MRRRRLNEQRVRGREQRLERRDVVLVDDERQVAGIGAANVGDDDRLLTTERPLNRLIRRRGMPGLRVEPNGEVERWIARMLYPLAIRRPAAGRLDPGRRRAG